MSRKPIFVFDKLDQMPDESIEHYYRRLAKQADQRLVRLEAASHDTGFKKIKNWAYKKAIKDIEHWSGAGSMRFNTKPPETKQQLEAKIHDIRAFLEAPTSTKSGVLQTYKKRAASINKTIPGANFTWEDLAKVFEPAGGGTSFADLKTAGYDSGQILQVYSAIKEDAIKLVIPSAEKEKQEFYSKMLIDLMKENDWSRIIQVEDEFVGETVIEMLNNGDLKPEDIWGDNWQEKILKVYKS